MVSLKKFPIYTNVPVTDVERARTFYRDRLGLQEMRHDSSVRGAVFRAGNNTRIFLYQRERTTADHTIMSFHVKNIETVVAGLQENGVIFMEVQTDDIQTVNGVAALGDEKAAWFKDTEGNTLGLYERTEANNGKEVAT